MSENFEDMPAWAKELADRVEAIGKKLDEVYPETAKKKADFSKLHSELEMNDQQLREDWRSDKKVDGFKVFPGAPGEVIEKK